MFESISAAAAAALVVYLATPAQAQWKLASGGNSGVSAMQMTVAGDSSVMIIDKLEENPLHDSNDKPAWAAIFSTITNSAKPVSLITNSFCATGTWLSNGTLANLGGNPLVETSDTTATNGLQGIRLYTPCADGKPCDGIYESPMRIRLTSPRWYPSSVRLADGSALIYGGAYGGSWTNFDPLNNPTYEFYPPKNINGYNGMRILSPFLEDSLPHNMFPHLALLPNSNVFVAANNMAMLLNWETNTETRLPNLPNGQRVTYPMSGVGVLLPLSPDNNYKPEYMLCGGSELSDMLLEYEISSQSPASNHCARIVLDAAGIAAGWTSEVMPEARIMPDATILPDGKILITGGAKTGTAGYGNVQNQVGQSNADNPAYTPVLYDPAAAPGSRFNSTGMPTSNIPRMYHSTSTLLPDGRVMIAGSNPNAYVETRTYGTEYRVEYISPPYMFKPRPAFSGLPATWGYGQQMTFSVTLPVAVNPPAMTVSLMDLGFATHGVHMDMRMVKLKCTLSANKKTLVVTGPPNAAVYPPGPAWVYVLFNGVPSVAQRVIIGSGDSPPVDQGAIDNLLASTWGP
ncbi:DUF1929-domain-containing protein [Ceratobasidium sp. AG-I]|nr:DUF1929-domain-containing protein [Ceratobasidium sp. AG-I]